MKISSQATPGHLLIGAVLVLTATALMILNFISPWGLWGFLVHLTGV